MSKASILLVEDDPNLGQILKEYLDIKGYETTLSRDGEAGLKTFKNGRFDLCIFDVMMPRMDGYELAQEVRIIDEDVPIIFLTAKSMKEDTLKGFQVGADDYVTKPFSMEEMLMRIQAILRRTNKLNEEAEKQTKFEVGRFKFDYESQKLLFDGGDEQKLTSKESELLRLLALHKNQTMDRSLALKKIWLDDNYFNSRSMDVYITKLRKYLKADERLQIINVHGQGFKLVELDG
ncbi:MAG: DNA-binding response OmpR family regulator [Flammeovirgaceae bacterium]|jgi:two-component system OmpR family response regulator